MAHLLFNSKQWNSAPGTSLMTHLGFCYSKWTLQTSLKTWAISPASKQFSCAGLSSLRTSSLSFSAAPWLSSTTPTIVGVSDRDRGALTCATVVASSSRRLRALGFKMKAAMTITPSNTFQIQIRKIVEKLNLIMLNMDSQRPGCR